MQFMFSSREPPVATAAVFEYCSLDAMITGVSPLRLGYVPLLIGNSAMPPVRLALLVLICSTSPAHAGLAVTLVPTLPGPYAPGQVVPIDVLAQLDANSPQSIRVWDLQFDFSDSDVQFAPEEVLTHPDTKFHGDIHFWDFSSSSDCTGDSLACGQGYSLDSAIDADGTVNVTYVGLNTGLPWITLVQSTPRRVGAFEVTTPYLEEQGCVGFDILNADESDPLRGARLMYRVIPNMTPVYWSAHEGSITGGRLDFCLLPEPGTLALLFVGTGWLNRRTNTRVRERLLSPRRARSSRRIP